MCKAARMISRAAGLPPALARRPGVTATRPRGQGHEIRELRRSWGVFRDRRPEMYGAMENFG